MVTDIKNWSKNYIENLKNLLDEMNLDNVKGAAELLLDAYQKNKRIFIVGNGGSASTASHMVCDFSKSVRGHSGDAKWAGFKAIALTDNVPAITAWSNDKSYEEAYAQQLGNLASEGDLLIAISSSGSSKNILKCVGVAKKLNMKVIGIAGFYGGRLAKVVDVALVVNSKEYGPAEDVQLILNHIFTDFFYQKFKDE